MPILTPGRRAAIAALLALATLTACTAPLAPEDVRLDPGPPITGAVGVGYTNAEIRERLVAPLCADRGLVPATVAIGRIEGQARPVRATCG